jgi:hypothetical protein
MASTESGLLLKLKAALRKVGFRKEGGMEAKNEAILQTETFDDIEPEDATEEAYYSYQGKNRNHRNQYQNQGQNFQGQTHQGQNNQDPRNQGQGRQWNNNQSTYNQNKPIREINNRSKSTIFDNNNHKEIGHELQA